MLAVAAVRREHDPQRPEGGRVREEGAGLLRPGPGRPAHPHQNWFLRDLAEPRRQAHLEHVANVRRRHDGDEATAGGHV